MMSSSHSFRDELMSFSIATVLNDRERGPQVKFKSDRQKNHLWAAEN